MIAAYGNAPQPPPKSSRRRSQAKVRARRGAAICQARIDVLNVLRLARNHVSRDLAFKAFVGVNLLAAIAHQLNRHSLNLRLNLPTCRAVKAKGKRTW